MLKQESIGMAMVSYPIPATPIYPYFRSTVYCVHRPGLEPGVDCCIQFWSPVLARLHALCGSCFEKLANVPIIDFEGQHHLVFA